MRALVSAMTIRSARLGLSVHGRAQGKKNEEEKIMLSTIVTRTRNLKESHEEKVKK